MTMQLHSDRLHIVTVALTIFLTAATLLTACGGGSNNADSTEDAASTAAEEEQDESAGGAPTMPAARFAAVEGDVDLTKVAESADDATPAPDGEADIALGESAYGRLCAECHGEAGEGVADKGEAITDVTLESAAFDDLLRTGGGYGNEHIFGPNTISDDGIASLLAFVQTLTGE